MLKKKNGFTIVELLAVIVILAIVITIASSSVFAVIKNSHKRMAVEVRNNLKEASITYAVEKYHLEKCSSTFSKEIFEEQNITHANDAGNSKCIKKLTVEEIKNSGLFEDNRGFCSNTEEVYVYRYSDGVNSEYKSFVSDSICNN